MNLSVTRAAVRNKALREGWCKKVEVLPRSKPQKKTKPCQKCGMESALPTLLHTLEKIAVCVDQIRETLQGFLNGEKPSQKNLHRETMRTENMG
jgi:hypothetical protein